MTLGSERCGIHATFRWENSLTINFRPAIPGNSGLPFPNRDPAQIDRYLSRGRSCQQGLCWPEAKTCLEIGYAFEWVLLPADISQEELERTIKVHNQDPQTHGLLLQLPLPEHLDPLSAMHLIDPEKDVDGFHP